MIRRRRSGMGSCRPRSGGLRPGVRLGSELHESQRDRVDAVAEARRLRAIVEQVAEVRVATHAFHLALGTALARLPVHDVLLRDRRGEARPTRTGIELVGGAEERIVATDAAEESALMEI